MCTVAQNTELINNLLELVEKHRHIFGQERVYQRAKALVLSEIFVFGRHTITQQLMSLGLNEADWSAWYRLFSEGRFDSEGASEVLVEESLAYVREDEVYVVAGDSTQTPRSSGKMEGSGWLRNMRTPPFMTGIHRAQRWFNGSWLLPPENGYSRAVPIRWLPAFTEKSRPQQHPPRKEWEVAIEFLTWLQGRLSAHGRSRQRVLMVADGSYDTLDMWKNLPPGSILLARSAKNRVLHELPPDDGHGNRKYGPRAPTPQAIWRNRSGWRRLTLLVRSKPRHLQYRVEGPFLRKGAPDTPVFLIVVRGKKYQRYGHTVHRDPLPLLVSAVQDAQGRWILPLPVKTLLFWAWQRWEIEVCHRELKAIFGLGHKQCWNPTAAVASVQWSAWVYALLLLSAFRVWGLANAPPVPSRWWRGSGRWSFSTLCRSFRAALWGDHRFRPLWSPSSANWLEKEALLLSLGNAVFAAAPA